MNPSEFKSVNVTVQVRDDTGKGAASYTITLPPLGHTAIVLSSTYPPTAGKRGSLFLTSADGTFSVLGLRFNPAGAFTSFPPAVIQ